MYFHCRTMQKACLFYITKLILFVCIFFYCSISQFGMFDVRKLSSCSLDGKNRMRYTCLNGKRTCLIIRFRQIWSDFLVSVSSM
ncbi:hypothetical protein M6B38_317130 [Iris pallida]|uniref:Secreted protein n=1 Tax=Iris pallida TaxID=29817 RepID=A0AAX6HE41_IRIPA|nr:hypothetical protein M6B38_317130 [Iris pallida]